MKPDSPSVPQPRSIPLPPPETGYAPLLGGPPESLNMHSGCVTLAPAESVGMHSTEDHEEMIVPLSGIGELIVEGVGRFTVQPGCVLYNPPDTLHDVVNTGSQPLRYLFIVARV